MGQQQSCLHEKCNVQRDNRVQQEREERDTVVKKNLSHHMQPNKRDTEASPFKGPLPAYDSFFHSFEHYSQDVILHCGVICMHDNLRHSIFF